MDDRHTVISTASTSFKQK